MPNKTGTDKAAELKTVRQEVDELHEEEAAREKALLPYSDNLPYDRNRVIEETKFLLKHEIVAKYEIGRRLILLREMEGCPNFGQLLEKYLPGLKRQRAYEYILFAQKITGLPKLMDFAQGGKNWVKILLLLEACDEDELAALEAGESIAGKTLDDVDKMTVRELKKALRKAKDKTQPLQEQIAEQDAEKRELQAEIDLLKSGKPTPEYYINQVKKLEKAVDEVVRI